MATFRDEVKSDCLYGFDEKLDKVKIFSRWNILEKQDLKSIHEFVFSGNAIGDLSRQELVSMVPVLLLVKL